MNVSFTDILVEDKARWKSAISNVLDSLPENELKHVPCINIHKTLVSALYDTFDKSLEQIDDVAKHYFNINVWAFAHLYKDLKFPINDPRRSESIIFVSKNGIPSVHKIPMELTIFHEIGHFFIKNENDMKLKTDGSNEMEVELMCDRYSLMSYLRMLCRFPEYNMITTNNSVEKFNQYLFRRISDNCAGKKPTKKKCYEIADKIMKELKWKEVYQEMYVQSPFYNSAGR
jgi:hypothetical protein